MSELKNFRDLSKQGWEGNGTTENINIGSLQRIADAIEAMAQNFIELQNDRDLYKRWYFEEREISGKLRSSNYHLRGHITRLKNKNYE
jgi:hypothetical protein